MAKFVEVKIQETKSISNIIGDSLKIKKIDIEAAVKIFEYNVNPIIKNWNKFSNYLMMGDVQSGKTNNLIYLSHKLLESKKVDVIFYLTGSKNNLLNQNQERFFSSFTELGDSYQIYRNINIGTEIFESNRNKKIIINSLKTTYRLEQIRKLIESNSPNINFLLIDDEADEGSTSQNTFKLLKCITGNKNIKYLAITATPFKNLYKNQDFYDYFHVLKPGVGYQGLKFFHEKLKVLNSVKEIVIRSFIEWIIKCSTRDIKNSQILFNVMNLNRGHEEIFILLKNILNKIKLEKNLIKTIKVNYPREIKNIKKVNDFVSKLSVEDFIINNGDTNEEPKNVEHEIIIGGLKLSRGITYKNLVSEVMINMGAKEIDPGTLIQRARWLGYGKKLEEIDIYVNENVKKAFEEAINLIGMTKDFSLADGKYNKVFKSMKYERLKLK